jgi:hypothetical protein
LSTMSSLFVSRNWIDSIPKQSSQASTNQQWNTAEFDLCGIDALNPKP